MYPCLLAIFHFNTNNIVIIIIKYALTMYSVKFFVWLTSIFLTILLKAFFSQEKCHLQNVPFYLNVKQHWSVCYSAMHIFLHRKFFFHPCYIFLFLATKKNHACLMSLSISILPIHQKSILMWVEVFKWSMFKQNDGAKYKLPSIANYKHWKLKMFWCKIDGQTFQISRWKKMYTCKSYSNWNIQMKQCTAMENGFIRRKNVKFLYEIWKEL